MRGYPWIFFNANRTRWLSLLVTVLIIGLAGGFFFWYRNTGGDPTPDGLVGYSLAFSGTTFMLLAWIRYSMYRRSRKRAFGKLNASLNWHISLGFIAFALLLMHSFGNFNPRTGTYALYGMIAMVISGIIGRALDHAMPRLTAKQATKALTEQGEDRLASITNNIQSIVQYNKQQIRGFSPNTSSFAGEPFISPSNNRTKSSAMATTATSPKGRDPSFQTSWDMAYISLEETPQEVNRVNEVQYRFVPDKKSALTRPGALMPGSKDHIEELHTIEKALQREQLFRYITRYWRVFHVLLALVTVGLTIWHIEYALALLIPVWLHH